MDSHPQRHTYNLGIIGNCNYLAYINMQANVSWLCWPRFDSSFVLGSLLDGNLGGEFSITPVDLQNFSITQEYIPNTNILETTFESEKNSYKVVDFAPRFMEENKVFTPLCLVRKVVPIKGTPQLIIKCSPRYDYGQQNLSPIKKDESLSFEGLSHQLQLKSNASLHDIEHRIPITLSQALYFELTFDEKLKGSLTSRCEHYLQETTSYWQNWIRKSTLPSIYQEEVTRSLLTLKLHQYEPTGAIIAAGTTSLPECPNTERNWDYRYCWPRDTYYTLSALNTCAHFSELEKYAYFVQEAIRKDSKRLQPVFKITGPSAIPESTLKLAGYLGNRPVRIGNLAYLQEQFDAYGQIILSLLPVVLDQKVETDIIYDLLGRIEKSMDQPDSGLWEFRNIFYHHTHTYLFHWAGCQAAMKIADNQQDPKLKTYAAELQRKAISYIEQCYDPVRKVYKAATKGDHLDASCLLLVNFGYLDPSSKKAKAHVEGIYRELKSENGLLYRYQHQDDFGSTESSFLVCTFWYIEALAATGQIQKAKRMFAKVLKAANHLGLLSEDAEGKELSQWGNFPQTYCHVGVINCAFKILQTQQAPV